MQSISKAKRAWLLLEDGTALEGRSFGAEKEVSSEVVFSTGPTGYPEALTDPSFRGQVLTLTQPMIGNYGVPDRAARDKYGLPAHFESDRIHADGLVCLDYSERYRCGRRGQQQLAAGTRVSNAI